MLVFPRYVYELSKETVGTTAARFKCFHSLVGLAGCLVGFAVRYFHWRAVQKAHAEDYTSPACKINMVICSVLG